MKEVIGFLEQLEQHNDREWFNQHKDQYRAAQARFDDFAGQLIAGIATFDDSIRNLLSSVRAERNRAMRATTSRWGRKKQATMQEPCWPPATT